MSGAGLAFERVGSTGPRGERLRSGWVDGGHEKVDFSNFSDFPNFYTFRVFSKNQKIKEKLWKFIKVALPGAPWGPGGGAGSHPVSLSLSLSLFFSFCMDFLSFSLILGLF